jgi:hypothetical protein
MKDTLRYPVDIEHVGLRAAVLVTFFAASAIVCALSMLLVPDGGLLVAGVVAVLLGIGAAALLERSLKGRWLSGRELHLDAGGLRLMRKGEVEKAIDAGAQVEVLRWRFQARKQRRIPKGWYVVALALLTDETTVALYTLMSPQRLEAVRAADRFKTLMPPAKTGSATEDMRLAGEQRRLHEAEVARWNSGAELSNDAFEAALSRIDMLFG